MDISAIPLSDITALLDMYGEPIPNDPNTAYEVAYDLLSELSLEDPLPLEIQDLYKAQDLYMRRDEIPMTSVTDILLSPNEDLVGLAEELELSQVNKEQIIRILTYLERLDNDLNILDALPQEIIEEIATNLDCKSLLLLCQASERLSQLYEGSHILKEAIRNKGYRGGYERYDY